MKNDRMRNKYFLCIGEDTLESARPYRTKAAAMAAFADVARELSRYGQEIDATVHLAPNRDATVEYPDLLLSLGPRGGVRVERA